MSLSKIFAIDELTPFIEESLSKYQLLLSNSRVIADAILKQSDDYIQNPTEQTPWKNSWSQIAYLTYYHPLNWLRNRLVIQRGQEVGFFADLNRVIDFGAGLGTASLALRKELNLDSENMALIEKDPIPHRWMAPEFHRSTMISESLLKKSPEKTLAVFSYSLTELTDLPAWAYRVEGLMLLDPSTQQDGRRLMQLRKKLLEQGYHVWAPCTHHQDCPLLEKSKTDWCHDRLRMERPEWWLDIEKHLPFKNESLTVSYLLARKKAPSRQNTWVRTVGDVLEEKGKSRQMICRGPEREFLSWLHRDGEAEGFPRGELISLPMVEPKGNELRVIQPPAAP